MFAKIQAHFSVKNGVLLIALLLMISWVWGTVDAIQKNFELQRQVDTLSQQIGYQELENETLGFENQYYQSNEYLRLSAREHLSKAEPGEKLLTLPPNTVHDSPVAAAPVTTPITKRSNFQQWLYFLFGAKG